MGRHKKNPVYSYFSKNIDKDRAQCLVEGCGESLVGFHAGNMERHMKSQHPTEHTEIIKLKSQGQYEPAVKKIRMTSNIGNSSNLIQKNLNDMFVKKQISIKITKQIIIDACVELVTVNGRPFTLIEDSGFRKLLDPVLEGFNDKFAINSQNIRNQISPAAQKIRQEITKIVENRLICLKMDCVTRHDRSILGVNIQIIHNDELVLKTLAMIELKIRHTGENLKNEVFSLLNRYNIDKEQIYTVTTDNGANMVKMVDLMSKEEDIDEDNGNEIEENESEENENEANPVDFSNEILNIVNELDVHTGNKPNLTSSIRCSAHTLQLCVLSSLKTPTIQKQISRARNSIKKLRTPNVLKCIKALKLRKPVIDIPTRWNSTYDMLKSLTNLKDFYYDHSDIIEINISDYDWNCFTTILTSLEPAKVATIKLQNNAVTLGDFYGIWMQCYAETKKINSTITNALCVAMETRELVLLQNEVFLSAIYLDARYQCLLSADCKIKAIKHLCKVWEAQEYLVTRNGTQDQLLQNNSPTNNEENSDIEIDDDLEELIKTKSQTPGEEPSTSRQPCETGDVQKFILLESFGLTPRLHHKTNILQWWISQKESKPELYKLAVTVLAVPSTQVSVERSFSGVKFILSDLRTSLDENILEDIMVIRGNN
ncbi:unnamed protein product [Macrosiphum euphorbiae]|uniref:HAT C-terminal dimerisation domain-containing protein n=1 Tax=Macrosiphum euphorbiae TaxID=13131 RepID=A0AAV0Y3Z5_9HEMI|nr:unnamed protein product [Macrosiphum euphorbiae]